MDVKVLSLDNLSYFKTKQDLYNDSKFATKNSIPTDVSQLVNDAEYQTKTQLDAAIEEAINNAVSSVMTYKGTKNSPSELPQEENKLGDVWHVTSDTAEYAWDGTKWEVLGSTMNVSVAWDDITGKPSEFTPAEHTHDDATTDVSGFMSAADKTKLKAIRQKVGLVFQYPEHQLFEMTVFKDVCYGPKNMGLSEEEVKNAAEKALSLVGLDQSFYDKSPFELSGGQKRRVAIAGILAMNPRVLVLDEPTAGVDPRGRDEILGAIDHMHKETGITVILVSHSMEDVAKFADRIVVMNNGHVALTGTPKEVFSHVSELEEMGLAAPQTSYVMKGLKDSGLNVPQDVYTVDEATDVLYELLKQVTK